MGSEMCIRDSNKVVNTNKTTTDKALNDNLNTAKGYADTKANDALTDAQTYADGKANSALANAQTYADGKANSALANATKYVDTQLKISKEGLESQILGTGGGVNLALTSDSDWTVPASNAYIGDSNKCIELSRYVLDNDTFSKGDTITYSVHLSFNGIQGNTPTMVLQSVISTNDWNHAIYPQCNIHEIPKGGDYEITLKGTATLDPFPTALGTYILQIRFDHITAGTVKFCKVKIEKGSVATPYVASDTSYRSLIKATDRKLEGAVMKGTDYAGMIITPEHGFTAVANNMNFTLNKNAGFVINNKSDNVFKVDPSGNLTMKGNITAGNISGVNFTGQNLNLQGSLKVTGLIESYNGSVVVGPNGITVKDGGLNIVNNQGQTTTMIRDDGTFSTNKGFFSGTITGSNIILSANDGSVINANGGAFMVDGAGNVTANSIKITGNRKDNVNNLASLNGVSIYNGSVIEGSIIKGNEIISSEFYSTKRESAIGTYYPISNSMYTPSFFVNDDGAISVHTAFPRSFSLATGINKPNNPNDNVGPIFKVNEAFDRNTLAGSIGYGKGYDYPVPYLYGQQGGMPSYPIDTNDLSIVWLNDVTKDILLKQSYCDNYRYTQIASVSGITSDYKSKVGRIKINFGIVDSYGSYDVDDDISAGGIHDLILVLTTGPINGGDLYHVDPQMAYFNNMNNDIKIKMVSKKILTGATGHTYYNLYGELSTQDLGPADTYYLGVLQQGFVKSEKADSNMTWKIQIDNLDVVPDSTIDSDQSYYMPRVGGSYRELAISPNGSIITQRSRGLLTTASEYNAEYITFSSSIAHHQPYWTTINSDGIGFSIGDNSVAQDGGGNNIGLQTRQCIYFSGDSNRNGMSMDNYGNVHGQADSLIWRVYNNQGDEVFNVPFDPNGVFNFYVPKVNKNTDPNHKWGGLKIGWVYFDQEQYRWAETVPAIYNTGGRVKGIAMFDQYLISFVDGWCYQLSSWWNHGVPKGVDSSNGEAQGTNTDAGHRGV